MALLNTKGGQPLVHTRRLLVERDNTVDQGARVIAILVDWLEALAERRLVHGRHLIVHVVERLSLRRVVELLDIDSTAVSSALALPQRALEPNDSIKTALD